MPQSGQFPDMNYIGPEVTRTGPELRYTNYSGQEEIQEQEDGAHPQYANNFYDTEEVERFRLERKRERNRIAATKCRQRKLEKIAQLDSEVNQLKEEHVTLKQIKEKLKEEALELRKKLRQHIEGGCVIQQAETQL